MTNTCLTLEGVSYALPDGRILFHDLNDVFDQRRTGLVGRNGAGKSVLARILAGELAPTSGRCTRNGAVHYLAQQIDRHAHATVAGLAGVQPALDALRRIEDGSADPADFDAVGDRWDLRERLQAELDRHGLAHLRPDTPAATLSGGEAMRVALVAAWLSDAAFLILDEPSNHLDRANRDALLAQLQRWPGGLLVVSHDRALLQRMERIVELSPLGLRSYGGGYAVYAACQQAEQESARQLLEQRKLERRRAAHAMHEQQMRQQRRAAQGARDSRGANQAAILLGGQKNRAEHSAGKLRQQQVAQQRTLSQQVQAAAQQVAAAPALLLHATAAAQAPRRCLAQLDAVTLPHAAPGARPLHLTIGARQRIGVTGPNGCGKSTLLKLLAGQLAPLSGRCQVHARTQLLDQRLDHLAPQRSALDHLLACNRTAGEATLRTYLAQLGLDARSACAALGTLSGGERMKAALACALYADPPAQLLLLDEPGNHLDLTAQAALEAVLRQYRGALVLVSHDPALLAALQLSHLLVADPSGWSVEQQ